MVLSEVRNNGIYHVRQLHDGAGDIIVTSENLGFVPGEQIICIAYRRQTHRERKVLALRFLLARKAHHGIAVCHFQLSEKMKRGGIVKTLREVKSGETVTVVKLNGEGAVKRRIMDMGITKGCSVYIRKVAPLGDPVEITVRGYELSVRKEDAQMVEVE